MLLLWASYAAPASGSNPVGAWDLWQPFVMPLDWRRMEEEELLLLLLAMEF